MLTFFNGRYRKEHGMAKTKEYDVNGKIKVTEKPKENPWPGILFIIFIILVIIGANNDDKKSVSEVDPMTISLTE